MNNVLDQNNVFPYGEPLIDFGLVNISAVDGYGLVTRGFLWQGDAIWGPYMYASLTPTTWITYSLGITIATTWTAYAADVSLTTGWTTSQFGLFNEYPAIMP